MTHFLVSQQNWQFILDNVDISFFKIKKHSSSCRYINFICQFWHSIFQDIYIPTVGFDILFVNIFGIPFVNFVILFVNVVGISFFNFGILFRNVVIILSIVLFSVE
uniref:Uncharacterized protein n=1 Tax=Cacopsylla melanoneura TaxID=428564 RepID=A0A8D8LU02_9HEMI